MIVDRLAEKFEEFLEKKGVLPPLLQPRTFIRPPLSPNDRLFLRKATQVIEKSGAPVLAANNRPRSRERRSQAHKTQLSYGDD